MIHFLDQRINMLKIRLKRTGRKNNPAYRMLVVDSRRGPKSNNYVEKVGHYNPITKDKAIDADRVKYWIGEGAQPSDTVYNMLVDAKVIDGKKKNVLPQKSPVVKEPTEEELAAEKAATEETAEPAETEEAPTEEKEEVSEPEEKEETAPEESKEE